MIFCSIWNQNFYSLKFFHLFYQIGYFHSEIYSPCLPATEPRRVLLTHWVHARFFLFFTIRLRCRLNAQHTQLFWPLVSFVLFEGGRCHGVCIILWFSKSPCSHRIWHFDHNIFQGALLTYSQPYISYFCHFYQGNFGFWTYSEFCLCHIHFYIGLWSILFWNMGP